MGKNERRIDRNHPDFESLFGLANRIAQATNPQRFFDGAKAQAEGDTQTPEYKAATQTLKDEMESQLRGGIMRDFISGLNIRD